MFGLERRAGKDALDWSPRRAGMAQAIVAYVYD
jgi:hypothetical protein